MDLENLGSEFRAPSRPIQSFLQNSSFLIQPTSLFDTKFLVFDTEFLVFNANLIIFTDLSDSSAPPVAK